MDCNKDNIIYKIYGLNKINFDKHANEFGGEELNKFTDWFLRGPKYMECKYGPYHQVDNMQDILDIIKPTVYFIGGLLW